MKAGAPSSRYVGVKLDCQPVNLPGPFAGQLCADRLRAVIRGSLHAPSASFENRIPGLVDTVKSVQPGRVVFFCALSQVRGPTCAQKFADAVANIPELKDVQTTVLENGVTGWKEQFGGACDCPDAPCTHKLELLKA
eukprot:jgi/Mesvir1/27961/Mv20169-RA.1